MLELIVAAWLVAIVLLVATRRRPSSQPADPDRWPWESDLPCPWCRGATREDDPACPSCGRMFA